MTVNIFGCLSLKEYISPSILFVNQTNYLLKLSEIESEILIPYINGKKTFG